MRATVAASATEATIAASAPRSLFGPLSGPTHYLPLRHTNWFGGRFGTAPRALVFVFRLVHATLMRAVWLTACDLRLCCPALLLLQEHSRRAQAMAEALTKLGAEVAYPGLPDHPRHDLLKRLANTGVYNCTLSCAGEGWGVLACMLACMRGHCVAIVWRLGCSFALQSDWGVCTGTVQLRQTWSWAHAAWCACGQGRRRREQAIQLSNPASVV